MKMLWEIINMSDPYTIEADCLDAAFVACLFLGRGQYAFEPITEGIEQIPMFMFGGTEEWCESHFHEPLEVVINRMTTIQSFDLVMCLESCLIGKAADRETYTAGLNLIDDPVKRETWRTKWLEDRRSSMNNIGGRAYEMAKKLREGSTNPIVPAPQQVIAV